MQKEKVKVRVNNKNRAKIIYNHAQNVAENMDMGTLIAFARDTIIESFSKLSNVEITKIVGEYNPQILENVNDNYNSYE